VPEKECKEYVDQGMCLIRLYRSCYTGRVATERPETGLIFREVQDLHNNIFLVSVLYPALLLWYVEIYSLVFGKPAGVQNVPDLYLFALWFVFGVFFPLLFYCITYITEVRKDGIYTRLIPLNPSFKKIPIYVVEECRIQAYDPFTGKESEVAKPPQKKANLVVILKLISGKKMVISSKDPEKLCMAIQQASAFLRFIFCS